MFRPWQYLALSLGIIALSCSAPEVRPPATASPATRASQDSAPTPPLELAAPQMPEPDMGALDLSQVSPQELAQVGSSFLSQGDSVAAAQVLNWAVSRGADERYNLACALSLSNQLDGAFYWLQKAALEEGVDAGWAAEDSDLENLRADRRWARVEPYLQACNRYWQQQDLLKVATILPKGYSPAESIVTVVGLHGLGSNQEFVGEHYQSLADHLGVAFVGVSGTLPLGPRSYSWSEDPDQDHRRVQQALKLVKGKLTPRRGEILLFGFSQGAQMAFELAAAHPDVYRGAIVLSPGLRRDDDLGGLKPVEANKRQRFVLTAGEKELPGNVDLTRRDAEWARRAGAEVKLKLYPEVSDHTFPSDFGKQFPAWLKWLHVDTP